VSEREGGEQADAQQDRERRMDPHGTVCLDGDDEPRIWARFEHQTSMANESSVVDWFPVELFSQGVRGRHPTSMPFEPHNPASQPRVRRHEQAGSRSAGLCAM